MGLQPGDSLLHVDLPLLRGAVPWLVLFVAQAAWERPVGLQELMNAPVSI